MYSMITRTFVTAPLVFENLNIIFVEMRSKKKKKKKTLHYNNTHIIFCILCAAVAERGKYHYE